MDAADVRKSRGRPGTLPGLSIKRECLAVVAQRLLLVPRSSWTLPMLLSVVAMSEMLPPFYKAAKLARNNRAPSALIQVVVNSPQ